MKKKITLGIKDQHHDTSAAIVVDGQIVAASSQERFDRKKHSDAFPIDAINFCLEQAGLTSINQVDSVSIGMNYVLRIKERFLLRYDETSVAKIVVALEDCLKYARGTQRTEHVLRDTLGFTGNISYLDHHDCHAAACYYPSAFREAAVLTIDGAGEKASTRIYHAKNNTLNMLYEATYPNSIGRFYELITEYLGFKKSSDEGKVMGLAPYGTDALYEKMRRVLHFNSATNEYHLDMQFFDFVSDPSLGVSKQFIKLFGNPRKPEEPIEQRHKDIALAAQLVTQDCVVGLAAHAVKITGCRNLCMSGGVVLNSVSNGKIIAQNLVDALYIYPAAGDDGTSVGAALLTQHERLKNRLILEENQSPYLGPSASDLDISDALENKKLHYTKPENLYQAVAELLAQNKFVGWYQGRAEFGPRALGNRTIFVNPLHAENKDSTNSKIKFREAFRPFAPMVIEEEAANYFEMHNADSPYMILAFNVLKDKRTVIPAVTHIDGTARVQTVSKKQNERCWKLLTEIGKITGVPVLLNTSFNRNKEVIVNTPEDAIDCFLGSGLDALVLGDHLVVK